MSNETSIEQKVYECEYEYCMFMGISSLPEYRIEPYHFVPQKTIAKAQARYDFCANQYVLRVCEDFELSRNTLFHEFTHILDNEEVGGTDIGNYLFSIGYTEYHAAQIALLELLGCRSSKDENFRFSMKVQCADYPSVSDYILDRRQRYLNDMKSIIIPNDMGLIKDELGILFNYLGFVSVCKMYGTDYDEIADDELFSFFSMRDGMSIKNLMVGWLDNEKVKESMSLFKRILLPLISEKDKRDLAFYNII